MILSFDITILFTLTVDICFVLPGLIVKKEKKNTFCIVIAFKLYLYDDMFYLLILNIGRITSALYLKASSYIIRRLLGECALEKLDLESAESAFVRCKVLIVLDVFLKVIENIDLLIYTM